MNYGPSYPCITRLPLVYGMVTVPSQHQFGVLGDVLLDEMLQQSLHNLCEILQLVMKSYGEKASHVATIPL